jgi:hypothetical protein
LVPVSAFRLRRLALIRERVAFRRPEPDDDPVPADIDEFRYGWPGASAGSSPIESYWRDCKERSCRRQHACFAPHVRCSNAPPLPPDPSGRRRAGVMAQVQRALREVRARQEGK